MAGVLSRRNSLFQFLILVVVVCVQEGEFVYGAKNVFSSLFLSKMLLGLTADLVRLLRRRDR